MNLLFKIYWWILALFITGCAQQLTPEGGPIDRTPPKLIKASPPNESVNFNQSKITLQFDEYISLNNLQQQLIISPPLKNQPEFTVSAKKLIIRLKDTLQKNITYRIYLGNAIADIHEGNKTENFTYLFSTGQKIDTLTIAGTVINAFTYQPEENINVQVYPASADSIGFKNYPTYITKTNKQGNYTLRGMAPGQYKIIALKDLNNDYFYQPTIEDIAFIANVIQLTADSTKNIYMVDTLRLFNELSDKVYINKINDALFGKVDFIFNRYLINPTAKLIFPPDKSDWPYLSWNEYNDTLTVWNNNTFTDSLALVVKADNYNDTLKIRLKKRKIENRNTGKTAGISLYLQENHQGFIEPNSSITISSFFPLVNYAQLPVIIKTNSDSTGYLLKLLPNGKASILNFKTIPANEYELWILPNTLTDILGNSNDTVKIRFKTINPQHTGSLRLINAVKFKQNLIVELFNTKGQSVTKLTLKPTEEKIIENLQPETYKARIIIDENNNNRWDAGNFKQNVLPEKVIYKNNIQIKKRFETNLVCP